VLMESDALARPQMDCPDSDALGLGHQHMTDMACCLSLRVPRRTPSQSAASEHDSGVDGTGASARSKPVVCSSRQNSVGIG
jgi:hypothetical protein